MYAVGGWEGVPHEWLLPRVAAVVHHGGAGTLGAAFRAGRPQLCCPFGMDQPFWARRAHALGVATEPLAVRRLTSARLARQIRELLSGPTYRERAGALSERVHAEDGVGCAVRELEALALRTPSRPPR
ncbi:MAG: glycosyltransferase [Gemmatimonadetes bacterium]|nr:glycosyltransferase [Gemmatimonadota bacterium]